MATPPISMLCSYPQGDSSALGRELMPPGTTLVARSQKGPGHPRQGLLRETELGLLPRNKNMTKVLVVQLELQGHRAGGPTPGRSHPALPAAHLHLPPAAGQQLRLILPTAPSLRCLPLSLPLVQAARPSEHLACEIAGGLPP